MSKELDREAFSNFVRAIQDIRDPDKFDAGGTSPAQLTSCPWCGCEISPKHDVEVDTTDLPAGKPVRRPYQIS